MSFFNKVKRTAKKTVGAVKEALTSDIGKQAREQYTTGTSSGGNSRVIESVKNWANSIEPQNNSVRPSYTVSSYKNTSQDVKSFYNQQNNNLVNSVKNHMMGTNRTATNNLRRKQNAQVNKAINAGANAFYSFNNGSQFGGTAQSSLATIDTYKPKTMVELAAAAALRDTTNDRTIQEFQSRHTLDQGLHNNIIGWGQHTLSDQDAVTNWILEGKDDEEKQHRIEEVEEYMKRCFHEVPTYDPATGKYSTSSQIKLDAELPPWIIRNATALDWWDYYKTYSHDVVKSTSDAFRKARDEGRIQARTPYKSAFSTSEEPGAVNSFLDVLIDGIDTSSLSNTYENILQGSIRYVKEYTINPIKVGRLDTAAGNALYNMMETMDIASLGVRAFTAGALALGGRGKLNYVKDDRLINTGNTFLNDDLRVEKHRYYKRDNDAKFKGQNVYWAKIEGHITKDHQADEASKNAQRLFMDKGGYELLMMDNPNYASKADLRSLKNKSREDIIRELDAAFANSDISWRDIYTDIDQHYFSKDRAITDLKQGIQNVKQAYTDVDASYAADTGNMAADMIIETVLDPGLIAGGIAKGATKGAVSEAAETAVSKGLQVAFKDSDEIAGFINKPEARAALNSFINSNEGKNIIFKDAKNFDEDVRLLMDKFSIIDDSFKSSEVRDKFSNMMVHELIESSTHKNSLIMSSIPRARDAIDSKAFKAAYALDRTVDAVDSAIIKSSFFVPWAGVKGAKAGFNVLMDTETAARVMAKVQLKKNRAAAARLSDKTGKIDLTKTEDVFKLQEQGAINEAAVRYAMGSLIDEYDQIAFDINGLVNRMLNDSVSDVDALREVSRIISDSTGGVYNSVEDLAGYVDSLAVKVKYAGDIKSAYSRVDNTFKRLQNAIDYRAKGEVDEFKRLEREELLKGVEAVNTVSDKSFRRTINYDDFKTLVEEAGLYVTLSPESISPMEASISKSIATYLDSWVDELGEPIADYAIQDVIKFIDRLERQCQFKMLVGNNNISVEASALAAHRLMGNLNALRKRLKKIDVINLRDTKVVTLLHTDRVALLEEFSHNASIQELYGSFYDDVVAPIWKEFRGKTSDEIELMSSSLFKDIDSLARQKYGFDRTNQLIDQIRHLPDFTDDQLYSAVSSLGSMFNTRNGIGELMLYPGQIRSKLTSALRNITGESKVGKANIRDILQSVDSDTPSPFLQEYFKEFEEKPELRELYDKYVFQDALDPKGDVERQMLFTVLMDPSVVEEWNDLAKQGGAFTFHINTTGLNSEINDMTSVAFRKWVPLEVTEEKPLTLERLLNAFESEKTVVFQRGMTDSELETSLSENVLRRLGMKDVTKPEMLKEYKTAYGVTDERPHLSEQELVEQVCDFLRKNTNAETTEAGLKYAPPALIAHDMDGFNISYFTDKVNAYRNLSDKKSSTAYYADYISNDINKKAKNTYKRLADQVGETAYTDEQINTLTQLLEEYVGDINYHAQGYRFNDMRSYSSTLNKLVKTLNLKKEAGEITDLEDRFLKIYESANGDVALDNYVAAIQDITDLTIEPRGWAFASQNDDNLIKSAIDATGRCTVNVDTRIYVDDVLSYFNLDAEDGFLVNVEDLQKMNDLSSYIRRMRDTQITADASARLKRHKEEFDRIIQSCIDIANDNAWESTQLAYIQKLRIPDNPIDSFLMVKKLYNDHLKYWIDTDELTSLRTGSKNLDAFKMRVETLSKELRGYEALEDDDIIEHGEDLIRIGDLRAELNLQREELYKAAADYYNHSRIRFFNELTAGGFDIEKADSVDALIERFSEEDSAYFHNVSETIKGMWDDWKVDNRKLYTDEWDSFRTLKEELKKDNKAIKEEFFNEFRDVKDALYRELDEEFANIDDAIIDAYNLEREYKTYLYNDIKQKSDAFWADYRVKKEAHNKLYETTHAQTTALWDEWKARRRLLYSGNLTKEQRALMEQSYDAVKVRADELWEKYFISKTNLADLREEGLHLWDEYETVRDTVKSYSDVKRYFENKRILKELTDTEYKRIKGYCDELDAYVKEDIDKLYSATKAKTDALAATSSDRYEAMSARTNLYYDKAKEKYQDESIIRMRDRMEDFYANVDTVSSRLFNESEEVLDLLQGAHEPEIYKWAARSDYEKRVLRTKDGILRDGLDKATRYAEVNSEISSNLRQLRSMDDFYTNAGFSKKSDTMLALTHTKAKQLFDILEQSNFLKRESFQTFIARASEAHRLKLQRYRYESLLVDGAVDRNKLLSELVYNGFNMSVFNSHNYSIKEMDDLRKAVNKWISEGDDFLSYYEDKSTGNIFVYLNNNCTVAEQGKFRYINETYRFEKPVHDVVPYAEFNELKDLLDLDDIDDFEGVYHHLLSCWEDIRLLSFGAVNGTTGRTVSFRQAEDFMASLPSNMNDWNTAEGLLKHELARDVIYDPGFVIDDESDMLTDFLGTLHRQADVAKDDCIIINEVFHNNGLQFNDLAQNFTNDELIEYFGNNPDYVVCTIIEDRNTATGLSVRQLNLNNEASVQAAKQMPNTAILPYSVFYEVAENMNRSMDDNVYKRLLGKYMLAYKAFSLVKPGTWMRNYFDATLKASIDGGGGASNILSLLNYESKAIADMGTYGRLLADPTLLKEANWDMVQRVFNTDMTYEEFELLKGVVDGGRYKSADKYFIGKAAEKRRDFNIISGKDIGLRNLEEKDIKKAYKQFLSKEADLPLKEKQFMDFYLKKTVPTELEDEQFEYMFRKLSNNMRNANAGNLFDKTIDNMFKPFGYVESMVRYAQTMYLHDMGFSQNQTLRRIHATQFYNAPSWGMWNKLEAIVPFITFKYNNIMFWIRMMDENPRYFRYFEDIYGEIMNTTIEDALDEGQDMDYQYDYGLQSGGIPLGSAQHYFNVGNSFLSAMDDFYGIGHDIDSLNPVLREAVRGSFYALGLNSNKFFSTVDLNPSDEKPEERLLSTLPGYKLGKQAVKLFHNLENISSEEGGPSMEVLYSTLNFLGVLGVRKSYDKSGKFDMDEYQEELARQGMWYDFNQGKVVPISEKNDFGANAPGNSFEDVQAYMLIHHGKIWDANQHKFVPFSEFQAGGYNLGFDFEHDPNAWNALCEYMRKYGKVWDYNQRKFVLTSEYISGGLNDPDLTWDEKIHLMEEKFPNLKWDANQNTFVEFGDYISGGLNDYQNLSSSEFLRSWNELQSLRLALYGETYDKASKSFVKTAEPSIVLTKEFSGNDKREKYDNYFSMLGIPRLGIAEMDLHVSSDGLLMTGDGKYVITGNVEHDKKVFDKFRYTITYGGRGYSNWKNYSYVKNYNKTYNKSNKTYKGRTSGPVYDNPLYQTGVGWNRERGYYRLAYEYSIHYSGPQPGRQVNYLITPPKIYPYGGGYSKFSFQNRY